MLGRSVFDHPAGSDTRGGMRDRRGVGRRFGRAAKHDRVGGAGAAAIQAADGRGVGGTGSGRGMSIDRQAIDNAIERQEWGRAFAGLRQLFRAAPDMSNAQFVLSRVGRIADRPAPVACRVAFLRSFTLEPVIPLLRAMASLHGVDLTPHVGEFNTYAQEILDPGSSLYAFDPHVVVLVVQTRDILPDLWSRYTDLSAEETARIVAET